LEVQSREASGHLISLLCLSVLALQSCFSLLVLHVNRFGVYESGKNYKVLFNRRNQRAGETPEMYAAELQHIYDKAYAHRASIIRQEDLLQRFLMGLEDNKARVHIVQSGKQFLKFSVLIPLLKVAHSFKSVDPDFPFFFTSKRW
jgi:hypothetical protein